MGRTSLLASRSARPLLTGVLATLVLLVVVGLEPSRSAAAAGPTHAVSVSAVKAVPTSTPDAEAEVARARVDALLERYQVASTQVDAGLRALSEAFAAGAAAEVDGEAAVARKHRALATQRAQVRAVYAAGGPNGLTASVLGAASPEEALWRVSTADRVFGLILADSRHQVTTQAEQATLSQRRAVAADAATDAQAEALTELKQRAEIAATALAKAQATLSALDAKARKAAAARESARQIAAQQAAARAANRTALGTMTALGIPGEYQQAYQEAAPTCPGMDWQLLAGVGQVETGHGRNNRASSAGAIGPMQFMPATFAAYAVDGDHNGVLDPWDPQDAIFSAAHYLCVSGSRSTGAAGSAVWKHTALLAYNHAEWYVDLVLAAEQAIITQTAAAPQ
ncbi:MAG TPA: lytic transglycosylase domain-containing protein [Kineosporiaceae bacterium]|nr:lytic transglycosylase domain-containing protein [Kineosporiaceae bacterium]